MPKKKIGKATGDTEDTGLHPGKKTGVKTKELRRKKVRKKEGGFKEECSSNEVGK